MARKNKNIQEVNDELWVSYRDRSVQFSLKRLQTKGKLTAAHSMSDIKKFTIKASTV